MSDQPDTASGAAAESLAPGSVTGAGSDLDGDGRLDVIERAVGEVHETVAHIAVVVEGLAEHAASPTDEVTNDDTAEHGDDHDDDTDTSPVAVPWTHRKVW